MPVKNTEVEQEQHITFAAAFPKPLHAIRNGEPVRLIALGDIEGRSPGYLYVNALGETGWDSQGAFKVIDLDALPVMNATMVAARRATPLG